MERMGSARDVSLMDGSILSMMRVPAPILVALLFLIVIQTGCALEEDAESAVPAQRGVSPELAVGGEFMGRTIAPVRGHELKEWFDRPDRALSELPDRLVRSLPLDSTDVVADIGAGTGYFTLRLSDRLPKGRVLAVDIDQEMLDVISEKCAASDVGNVELIKSEPSDPRLPAEAVDLALIVDSYHEFSHPAEMLQGIYDGLRPGGSLVIVEYRGEDPTVDVDALHRMTEDQIRLEVESMGYEWVETRDFLPLQHVVIFRRPAR